MPDPFYSSHCKIEWAKKHLTELITKIAVYVKENPCESVVEPDLDKPDQMIQKICLVRPVPYDISMIAGDVVDNLRAALDHAVYAIAIASGRSNIVNAYFPFAGSAARFENCLNGRCADVPKEIYPLLRGFKPYKGGNNLLVALNQTCNRNKHALLIPFPFIAKVTNGHLSGTGFIVPPHHIWNGAKNEIILFTENIGSQRDGYFDTEFLITFPEIETIDNREPAVAVLNKFVNEVERILLALESESRRLGFCQ
jgi:hypothetical protein